MIVFVSDLHLEGSSHHFTVDVERFLQRMQIVFQVATDRKIRDLKLVLLGDIFELLKSRLWLDSALRPWEACTTRHVEIVEQIFRGIVQTNACFFSGLRSLVREYSVSLFYVTGNHDLLLNTPMGANAKVLLHRELGLAGEQLSIPLIFMDQEHKVIARHGHEWDAANRTGEKGLPVGDAVVIELIVALPHMIAGRLQSIDQTDLEFLKEIDNVRPQNLRTIVDWVQNGISQIASRNADTKKTIESCLNEVQEEFWRLEKRLRFESIEEMGWAQRMQVKAGKVAANVLGPLRAMSLSPTGHDGPPNHYRHMAMQDLVRSKHRFLLCGHTHMPEVVALDAGGDAGFLSARLYVNTGTWRRVYRRSLLRSARGPRIQFTGWDEECLVIIHSPEEQTKLNCPPYEFQRVNRGIIS